MKRLARYHKGTKAATVAGSSSSEHKQYFRLRRQFFLIAIYMYIDIFLKLVFIFHAPFFEENNSCFLVRWSVVNLAPERALTDQCTCANFPLCG